MNAFETRRGTLRDLELLAQFNQQMAAETEGKALDADTLLQGVRHVLEDEQHGFYWVADNGEQIVGQLMVTFEWSDWRNAPFWWVQSVYVHKEYRQKGVYKRLYNEIRTMALEAGACGLRLYVEKENEIAQQVYLNQGMEMTYYRMMEESL
jgi:GNAT superfamily N-acetyltransferase